MEIIVAGIGGQGVVFAGELLSQSALAKGLPVIGSETHGMAQRGGSVISHIKIGPALSPLVRYGNAGLVYGFDLSEFYRSLYFIKDNGICVVNIPKDKKVDSRVAQYLQKHKVRFYTLDADKEALVLNAPLVANLVMIGLSLALKTLPFTLKDIESILSHKSAKRFLDTNLKALKRGYQLASKV